MTANQAGQSHVSPWVRVAIMIVAVLSAGLVSWWLTGSVVPTKTEDALIFQSSLLLVVLGSAILERPGTKPSEALVNGLMGALSLVSVYGVARGPVWVLVFSYCAFVFVTALICVVASEGPDVGGWRRTVASWTFGPATVLGRARLLYSVVFLYSVFAFYGLQAEQTAILVTFWGIFVVLWPLRVPELLSRLSPREGKPVPVGRVVRVDSPGIIRIQWAADFALTKDSALVYQAGDGAQFEVSVLYNQDGDDCRIGTGLAVRSNLAKVDGLASGDVARVDGCAVLTDAELATRHGGGQHSTLLGFVVEGSRIAAINFETWTTERCREGLLVWCPVGDQRVYFQITDGVTKEENLEKNNHGFEYAIAGQLGTFTAGVGFRKYPWVPSMNTPVFCEPEGFGADLVVTQQGDSVLGVLPGTGIRIGGPFCASWDHHTAILGVTGSGKTELAFDLIRDAVADGIRVICVDLTARYELHLTELTPTNLSISATLADQLSDKLFEAETGQYGGGQEKKALKEFATKLRDDVRTRLESFLADTTDAGRVGVITLDEISNTKASLFITEMYMSWLLRHAREAGNNAQRVLIVVEEAHTVMPEPSTMGLGDYDSRGLVGKIAQIALQGRKYRVGLLVVAQRTATVSKTVLTQCNTVIALNCFDQTSVDFLGNIFGETHAKLVARLPRLHAVGFGKAFRSERPIVFEIPFDAAKAAGPTAPTVEAQQEEETV